MATLSELSNAELNELVSEKIMGVNPRAHDYETVGMAVQSGIRSVTVDLAQVEWNGNRYEVPLGRHGGFGVSPANAQGLHWFCDRVGKPWEADIEAHVTAWRRPHADYAADPVASFLMWEKMGALGYTREVQPIDGGKRLVRFGGTEEWLCFDANEPRACRALAIDALRTVWGIGTSRTAAP